MSYKTVVKSIDGDLCLIFPASFVNPLNWKTGDTVNVELVDNILQISKI